MVETRLRWFGHVERRHVDSIVKRVYQIEGSQITRCKSRSIKSIKETIKNDLRINEMEKNMIFDRTSMASLINIVDPT